MGLNPRGVEFLASLDLPLGKVATLGRQEMHGLDRRTMSELGLDPAAAGTFAEPLLLALGADSVASIDASDYQGATVTADLNEPLADDLRKSFDTVIDGGTLEHVFNFATGLANAMDMVRPGGWLVHILPTSQASGHGFYQLSPEVFFRALSPANGFRIRCVLLREESRKGLWWDVRDPDDVGHRVPFKTAGEAYLYVAAQRLEDRPILSSWPQQSDYASEWDRDDHQHWAPTIPAWRRMAARVIPGSLQARIRALSIRTSAEDLPVIGPRLTKDVLDRVLALHGEGVDRRDVPATRRQRCAIQE